MPVEVEVVEVVEVVVLRVLPPLLLFTRGWYGEGLKRKCRGLFCAGGSRSEVAGESDAGDVVKSQTMSCCRQLEQAGFVSSHCAR